MINPWATGMVTQHTKVMKAIISAASDGDEVNDDRTFDG